MQTFLVVSGYLALAICVFCLFLVQWQKPSKGQKNLLTIALLAAITMYGYCIKYTAHSLETMLVGQKLVYMCAPHLFYFMLMFMLATYRIHWKKVFKVALFFVDTTIMVLALDMENGTAIYKTKELIQINGVNYLSVTYGPGHALYIGTLTLYVVLMLLLMGHYWFNNRSGGLMYTLSPAIVMGFPVATVIVEAIVGCPYELEPASAIIAFALFVRFAIFDEMYAVSEIGIEEGFQALREGVILVDSSRHLITCNETAIRLFPELKGLHTGTDLMRKGTKDLQEVLNGDRTEVSLAGRTYEVHADVIKSKRGEIATGYWINDTTAIREFKRLQMDYQKKLLAEKNVAESAAKTVQSIFPSLSHEIRTPINAMMGMNEMILRESTEPQIREYAAEVRSAGNTLTGMINDILDYSKLEAGQLKLDFEEYDAGLLIGELETMMRVRASEQGLGFDKTVDPELPLRLFGDDQRIRQIILAMLSQSLRYCKEGRLTLNVGHSRIDSLTSYLVVGLATDHCEMDAAAMEIFFNQAESIESVMKNGDPSANTGLGMVIANHLLKLMGSGLKARNLESGGVEIFFKVKQKVVNWEPIGEIGALENRLRTGAPDTFQVFKAPNAKILVVDDLPLNLKVFVGLLKNTGIQIDAVESGRECVAKACEKKYDIIFIDHMMPDMDGIETLKAIRTDSGSKNIQTKAVVLTANATSGAKEQYLACGFNEYMSKPLIPGELNEILKKYLPGDLVDYASEEDGLTTDQKGAQPDEKAELLIQLDHVEGINVEAGLLAAGEREIYTMVVKEFWNTIQTRADMIEGYWRDEDLRNYTIQVHALKSTARMVGAQELSDLAKRMEECGKANDLENIDRYTPGLLDLYRGFRIKLDPIFNKEDDSKPEVTLKSLREAFETMAEGLQAFDFDMADSVMKQLERYRMPGGYEEVYKQLMVLMSEVARDDILKLLDDVLNKMER